MLHWAGMGQRTWSVRPVPSQRTSDVTEDALAIGCGVSRAKVAQGTGAACCRSGLLPLNVLLCGELVE